MKIWIAAASVLALAGCTASPDPVPAVTRPVLPHRDGIYQGTLTPTSGGTGCGFDSTVAYEVSGTHIWLRTHRQRRYVDGQIAPDGSFTMLSRDNGHQVAGSISGDRLTGLDTEPARHGRHSTGFDEAPCQAQVEAHFVATPADP